MSAAGALGGLLCLMAGSALVADTQPPDDPSILSEVSSGPTRAFDLLEDDTPLVVFVGRMRGVDLTFVNRGSLTWLKKKRVRVAYVWTRLSGERADFDPRRTSLPGPVSPGEIVELEARLGAPNKPGIYVLRWDVVEERVQWFSTSFGHPQFEHWVLVLPRVEYWLGWVLPTAVAVLGLLLTLWARHRDRASPIYRLTSKADLWWLFAAIFGKPHFLYLAMGEVVNDSAMWFSASVGALAVVMILFLPQKVRPLASWCLVALGTFVVFSQVIYFRFFRDVMSITSLRAAGQTGELGESIAALSEATDLLLLPDLLLALPLAWVIPRMQPSYLVERRWLRHAVAALLLLTAISPVLRMWNLSDWERTGRRGPRARTIRAVRGNGLWGYQMLDTFTQLRRRFMRPELTDDELSGIRQWFLDRADLRSSEGRYFGAAQGKNLLVLQVESMQQFVLGLEVENQPITPNLNSFSQESFYFPHTQDQTGNGRSSAGEFTIWTSIVPMANAVAYEFPTNRYQTLAHLLAVRGYKVLSSLPFTRSFWNRHRTYPAYGFLEGLWEEDFKMGEQVGWGLNDLDLIRQMLPRISSLDRPFLLWITTLSLHYPFDDFPDELKALDLGPYEGTAIGNYLHGMNLFDRAFGELMAVLEQQGILESTVVALWGDHDTGLIKRTSWPEVLPIDRSWPQFHLWDRVPFLVRLPGADPPRKRIDVQAGQTDIAPTMAALFGIDPAPMAWIGRNLLNDPVAVAPVVHPSGNWLSDGFFFIDAGESLEQGSCWDLNRGQRTKTELCRVGYEEAQLQMEISESMLLFDLQQDLSEFLADSLNLGAQRSSSD